VPRGPPAIALARCVSRRGSLTDLRFFDRSIETRTFKRGIGAYNNPSFYRQLGKDPEQIVRDALDVLAKRFNLY
jgi:hypothetical protein